MPSPPYSPSRPSYLKVPLHPTKLTGTSKSSTNISPPLKSVHELQALNLRPSSTTLPTPRLSQHRAIPRKGGMTPPGSLGRPVGHVEWLDICTRNALPPKLRSRHCKHLNSELGAQTALHLSVSKGVIQRKN